MKPVELSNTAVLDALGIPHKDQHIASVSIDLRQGRLPTVVIERYLDEQGTGDTWPTEVKRFTLEAVDEAQHAPPPLDIDAMAQAAQKRVAKFINRLADEHATAMRMGYRFPWTCCLSNDNGVRFNSLSSPVAIELKGLL